MPPLTHDSPNVLGLIGAIHSSSRPRGAKPTPRHALAAAEPYRPTRAPSTGFAVVPKRLSYWYNNQYGICVSAEEAFAKAVWSLMCGMPELFIPDNEVLRWATRYGYRDGAFLTEVMDTMAKDGFTDSGQNYKDGPYGKAIDYTNVSDLQSAIEEGPVKIGIDANALSPNAGNGNGWWSIGGNPGEFGSEDHCVGLSGHGSAEFLFPQLGLPVPSQLKGVNGFLLFTWSSLGFVDHPWLLATCAEAWLRNPTTMGQTPNPAPTPDPTPTPTPQQLVAQVAPMVVNSVPFKLNLLGLIPVNGTIGPITIPGQFAPVVPTTGVAGQKPGYSIVDIVEDTLAIWRALRNDTALFTAVNKLLADFGLPPLPFSAFRAQGEISLDYLQLLQDVWAVLAALRSRNPLAVIAAVEHLLADLGILHSEPTGRWVTGR